jgi:hypothetical protein
MPIGLHGGLGLLKVPQGLIQQVDGAFSHGASLAEAALIRKDRDGRRVVHHLAVGTVLHGSRVT